MKTHNSFSDPIWPNTVARRLRTACAVTLLPLLLLTLPAAVQAQFNYTTYNGAITITGYTGPGGDVTIPDTINSLPVAGIGDWAFMNCTSLTNITISKNVTYIGDWAFSDCTNLTAITVDALNFVYSSLNGVLFDKSQTALIQYPRGKAGSYMVPTNVISIGDWAFSDCSDLTSVTIPNRVTSIGMSTFTGCTSLSSITISKNVTYIGDGAFSDCTNLIAITVDALNSVYSSLNGVLFNKSQTTLIQYPGGKAGSYMVPNSVTSIGNNAFRYCTSLTSVTIGTNVTNIGDWEFSDCTSLTNVVIPNSVTVIGIYTFGGCSGLASVMVPDSVASIGQFAFSDCTNLTSVTIPNSVTNIGRAPFQNCVNLTAITVDALNPAYSSLDGVLFNKSQTTLIQYPGAKAGYYTVPGSVTVIGDYAFYNSTSLTGVMIPNSVTNMFAMVFACCANLTNVIIPNNVTTIGPGMFYYCTSLTSVTIPGSVTGIYDGAFQDCTNMTEVYFQGNAPGTGAGVLYEDPNTTVYYLPGTTGWSSTFGGRPAVLWNPQAQTSDASFGVRTNRFGFNITGTTNIPIVVEACTNLANPVWEPLQSCTLTNGSLYFSDPQWTNYPGRFYHIRWP